MKLVSVLDRIETIEQYFNVSLTDSSLLTTRTMFESFETPVFDLND